MGKAIRGRAVIPPWNLVDFTAFTAHLVHVNIRWTLGHFVKLIHSFKVGGKGGGGGGREDLCFASYAR